MRSIRILIVVAVTSFVACVHARPSLDARTTWEPAADDAHLVPTMTAAPRGAP